MKLPIDNVNTFFLSVGESCCTAHQIRRFTQSDEAFFYDWIVTTGESFKGILTDEKDFLQSGNWGLADDGDRLVDKKMEFDIDMNFHTLILLFNMLILLKLRPS